MNVLMFDKQLKEFQEFCYFCDYKAHGKLIEDLDRDMLQHWKGFHMQYTPDNFSKKPVVIYYNTPGFNPRALVRVP